MRTFDKPESAHQTTAAGHAKGDPGLTFPAGDHATSAILRLQRTIGNRAVSELIHANADHADAAAGRSLAMRAPSEPSVTANPVGALDALAHGSAGEGHVVPQALRSRIEGATGADVGGVRIHTGSGAHQAARMLSARAFTVGSDIWFAQGQYRPGDREGDRLIAHEVVHTIQQGLGAGSAIQPMLEVSQPGDAAEVEAESIANTIIDGKAEADAPTPMRVSAARKAITQVEFKGSDDTFKVDPYAEADSDHGNDTARPHAVEDVLHSSGLPLDPAVRGFMETRFGRDFSGVRIHSDAHAAESARAVGAHAYTARDHIVFGPGQYRPATGPGRRLLAHELVHVVQQTGAAAGRDIAGADGLLERRAHETGPLVAAGSHGAIQRQPDPLQQEANTLATELQTVIDGAIWKEIRKRVYPKESKAGIERAQKRHEGKLTDLSGLGKLTTLNHFATEVKAIQKKWPGMASADDRVKELGKAASGELVSVDVPGFLVVEKEAMEWKGYFQSGLWRFAISEALVSGSSLSNDDAAELTNTTLHEGRHAEQQFLAARYSAGVNKKNSAAIQAEQGIPKEIADKAVAKKFDAKTDAASADLGKQMYKATVTDAAANQKISDDDGVADMAKKRTDAQSKLAGLKASATAKTIADAKTARDALKAQIVLVEQRYTLYRNIPYEADAHEVGDAAEQAFKGWPP